MKLLKYLKHQLLWPFYIHSELKEIKVALNQLNKVSARLGGLLNLSPSPAYPSLHEQRSGKFKIIDSGLLLQPGVMFYNPTIHQFQNQTYLAYRRQFTNRHPSDICISKIEILKSEKGPLQYRLDPSFHKVLLGSSETRTVLKSPEAAQNAYEDPRLFTHEGKMWVSFSKYDGGTCSYMQVGQVDLPKGEVQEVITPSYGSNRQFQEKNWLFFESEGELFMIYSHDPFLIVKCDLKNGTYTNFACYLWENTYAFGAIRGGGTPVYKDGYFYSIFHSSLPDRQFGKRYFMSVLKFEGRPPFKPVSIRLIPLLYATDQEAHVPYLPLTVFPSGAYFDGEWVVSVGVNDLQSALMTFSHDEFEEGQLPIHRVLRIL